MMQFKAITVEGFEGPLDLLLDLIEKEKLDVSTVSLAHVADQYLDLLREGGEIPPNELADFLVVASRLILLKSRRLFPALDVTEEEEEDLVHFEEQLREYQKYRSAAIELRKWWKNGPLSVARDGYLSTTVTFYPPQGISADILRSEFIRVAEGIASPVEKRQEVMRRIVSLEERIAELHDRITNTATASFRNDVVKGGGKEETVVSFLALLHLIKQQVVLVEQTGAFRDILIKRNQDQ